jgi:membrane-bound serine protease (ClpP class)
MDLTVIALLLFVVGVILGVAEIFIPSAGLLVVLSIASFVGSVICAFKVGPGFGITLVLLAPIVMLVVVAKGFNIFPKTFIGRKMILREPGEDNPSDTQPGAADASQDQMDNLIGQEGVARTDLRPAGSAQIGDRRYQVVSAGDYIQPGTRIRVIEVRGNRIVVEAVS